MTCHAIIAREAAELFDGLPDMLTEADFRPYQGWMRDRAMSEPYIYVAAGMGLGKTGTALSVIRKRRDRKLIRRVLIIAPIKVCNDTWPEELARWDFARDLTFSVITGDEETRLARLAEDTDIHIVNRENVQWLYQQFRHKWPYDMLVYDEASRLKRASASTTPTARKDGSMSLPKLSEFGVLARVRTYFKYVIMLSGTPAPNGLIDLWGPFYILDKGKRLGTSKTAYKNRWFNYDPYTYKTTPHDHSEEEIMSRVADIMVSLREEDYLELPEFIQIPKYVHLPEKTLAKYRQFREEMYLEEYDAEAVNAGVLSGKLLQFANGSMYDTEGNDRWVHDHKLDMLGSVIEEAAGEPMMTAYSFKFDLTNIKKRYPKFRIFGDHANDKRDWDRGRIPLMLIHPASAGHGMNFQHGGHISCWYGLNPSLELYLQFNKRLHRSGQKADKVFQYLILARKTEDERMWPLVQRKSATQDSITEHVRLRYADMRDQRRLIG